MKILWHSNAPYAPTGYGQQTGLFAPLVAKHHELALSAFYGLEGARIMWDDIPVYPGLGGEFGNAYLGLHAASHFGGDPRAGLVFTLLDVWVLEAERVAQLNAACWVPVDHVPAPPMVERFFEVSGAVPIAMSKFGAEQLARHDPLYVPHGVDTEIYKPQPRDAVRDQVGIPKEAFVVGIVAANKGRPSRKGFQEALEAFKIFRDTHDDAYLYLHTTMDPQFSEGEALGQLLAALDIPPESVRIADQYAMMFNPYPRRTMARIYSALDVLLNPAHGEGFGIPVLEAQACGTPAIVTDFSAMKEVCGAGWHVAYRRRWTGQRAWQAVADVEAIVGALEECYGRPAAEVRHDSRQARKHAMQYKAEVVFEKYMLPALAQAAERFELRKPIEIPAVEAVAA